MPKIKISSIDAKKLVGENFVVDTNVWHFLTYAGSRSIPGNHDLSKKINVYSNFINELIENNCKFFTIPICLNELSNSIEKSEMKIYNRRVKDLKTPGVSNQKNYRAIETERNNVIAHVKSSWATIKSLATIHSQTTDMASCDRLLKKLESVSSDSNDLLYFQALEQNKIYNIITDDKDFSDIAANINVYHY